MKILIVGAGNAGLISALILKKSYPNLTVKIVHDESKGIIGVGEGSTEHFETLRSIMNWDQTTLWNECGVTNKFGIYFENWYENDWIQSVTQSSFETKQNDDHYFYELIDKGASPIEASGFEHCITPGTTPIKFDMINMQGGFLIPFQYHFDTYMLNNFLMNEAKNIGVEFVDAKVNKVFLSNIGISHITYDDQEEYADLFIDCSGFEKILSKHLNHSWVDLSNEFLVNSAVVWQTETNFNEIISFTKATALNAGWKWEIPTQTHIGHGYVYSDNHISDDDAIKEVQQLYNAEVARKIFFEPGYYEKVWVKNCVSIGLSGSFCEPLEATNIACIIQQADLLRNFISANDFERASDRYNKVFENVMINLFDFIRLHYHDCVGKTPFWIDNNQIELRDNLKELKQICESGNIPDKAFFDSTEWNIFSQPNFLLNLYANGWISSENINNLTSIKSSFKKDGVICTEQDQYTLLGGDYSAYRKIMNSREFTGVNLLKPFR